MIDIQVGMIAQSYVKEVLIEGKTSNKDGNKGGKCFNK